MPTPSEQKALTFVAIVILLGGAVRVLRAGSSSAPTTLEQQALARQATAADSAASQAKSAKHRKGANARLSGRRRDTIPIVVGGVASVPPTYARPDNPFAHNPYGAPRNNLGFPPPGPRIDTDVHGRTVPSESARPSRPGAKPPVTDPIDMDIATTEQIQVLPRIGPLLAKRIVANRDSLGAFRSIGGLKRVHGLGPATLEHLAPLVTFSGGGGVQGLRP